MLKERDVFREIIRLMGVALLVYGLLTILQSGISLMYFGSSHNNSSIALILAQPFIYILVGLLFLIHPALIAAFAYSREQTAEWSSGNILIIGVKLAGVWLILAHLGTFLQHLRYYLSRFHAGALSGIDQQHMDGHSHLYPYYNSRNGYAALPAQR